MKSTLKNHLWLLLAYIISTVAVTILGRTIILTIVNAIIDTENLAITVTEIIMRILWPLVAFVIIYIHKRRDGDGYKSYISSMEEKEYDTKVDFNELIHNKSIWEEIIFVSIITIVYWLFSFSFVWILLNIPLFIVFAFVSPILIHKSWLKDYNNI